VTKEEISRSLTQSRRRSSEYGAGAYETYELLRMIGDYSIQGRRNCGGVKGGLGPPSFQFSEDTKSALSPVAKCFLSS
jgi:hypothetical protein